MRPCRSLLATIIALGALFAVLVGAVRPPDAVLGVAFARACAAEAAQTDGPRPRLRGESEDRASANADALPIAAESAKTPAPQRQRDLASTPRFVAIAATTLALPTTSETHASVSWWTTESPTRARARLMVFQN